MEEKRQQWVSEGRWDPSYTMKDLAEACRPHWDLLKTNPDMIEPYVTRANEFRKETRGEKLDTLGRPLKALQMEAERIEKKWRDMETEIHNTVKKATQLKRKKFFVAHFNYLCEAYGEFPPCEASVVKFSLEAGIEDTWQDFVSPLDSVPVGFQYTVIKRARYVSQM